MFVAAILFGANLGILLGVVVIVVGLVGLSLPARRHTAGTGLK